jgi:Protein of unknown function (DUF3108)
MRSRFSDNARRSRCGGRVPDFRPLTSEFRRLQSNRSGFRRECGIRTGTSDGDPRGTKLPHLDCRRTRYKMVAIMIFARSALLPAIAAALLFAPGALTAPAAEADRIEARFEIFGFAGLHVLTNRTTIEESADRYAIAMDLDTRGLASVFVDLTSHSEAHGRLIRDAAHPDAYRADVRRNGADRHYGLDYRGDGTVINASAPPSAEPPVLVAADQIRGTVDQLTAYFILERQLAHRGTCAAVVPVFDGSGLYNLRFTDVKREALSADGYQNFTGPTQVCGVVREDVLVNRNQNEDTYRQGKVWYARVPAGDRMVPVRMEYDTAFGVVKGYLAELRGRGGNLHLMEE